VQVISLVWGILAIFGMVIAFTPCLGAFNWLNIPFAGCGVLFGGFAVAKSGPRMRGIAIAGLVLCLIAVMFGMFRLKLGGGLL
jgi:hypothetical protein